MNECVRDIHLSTSNEFQAIKRRLVPSLLEWSLNWGVADLEISVLAAQGATSNWAAVSNGIWCQEGDQADQALARLLSGVTDKVRFPAGDWTLQAAAKALTELNQSLADVAVVGSVPSIDEVQKPLSGAVQLTSAQLGRTWLFARDVVKEWLGATEVKSQHVALRPVLSTVAREPVQIQLGLGQVEIALSDLQSLQIGDVVRFPTELKRALPLAVSTNGQPAIECDVFAALGQSDGNLAIQIQTKTAVA